MVGQPSFDSIQSILRQHSNAANNGALCAGLCSARPLCWRSGSLQPKSVHGNDTLHLLFGVYQISRQSDRQTVEHTDMQPQVAAAMRRVTHYSTSSLRMTTNLFLLLLPSYPKVAFCGNQCSTMALMVFQLGTI